MDRQTLSIMKACEVVGVSRRTIYNWISAGKVEYVRTAGGSIRIFADSLWRPSTDAQDGRSRVDGREASAAPRADDTTSRPAAGPHA
jgi:excisionase family DNA binding protein